MRHFLEGCVTGCAKAALKVDDELWFPLRWTNQPASLVGYAYEKLSEYKRVVVSILEDLHPLSI